MKKIAYPSNYDKSLASYKQTKPLLKNNWFMGPGAHIKPKWWIITSQQKYAIDLSWYRDQYI